MVRFFWGEAGNLPTTAPPPCRCSGKLCRRRITPSRPPKGFRPKRANTSFQENSGKGRPGKNLPDVLWSRRPASDDPRYLGFIAAVVGRCGNFQRSLKIRVSPYRHGKGNCVILAGAGSCHELFGMAEVDTRAKRCSCP